MIKAPEGVEAPEAPETLEALPGKIENTRYFYLEYLGTFINNLKTIWAHLYFILKRGPN